MKHSKSSLFLMELIIAILFFSLASTVCIQLFVKSHLLSRQTVNQNHAVIQAQNLAEIFLASDGDPARMRTFFPGEAADTPENVFALWFDENWVQDSDSNPCYIAELTACPEENGLVSAKIIVYSADTAQTGSRETPWYTLSVSHHSPERRGNLEK